MNENETFVIPITDDTKKDNDIFRVGKHESVSSKGTIWEWEITKEARRALLEYHTNKPNI